MIIVEKKLKKKHENVENFIDSYFKNDAKKNKFWLKQ